VFQHRIVPKGYWRTSSLTIQFGENRTSISLYDEVRTGICKEQVGGGPTRTRILRDQEVWVERSRAVGIPRNS